ncbi:MAG: hypothetical protein HY670_05575 [Chloroflexi bacterium]|nr:hypothetical protein [Chloroflexota bacterium]
MTRRILIGILVTLIVVSFVGCSGIGVTNPSKGTLQIVRRSELGTKWEMKQAELEIGAGEEYSILLRLAEGDKVDGFFFVEKGANVDFVINGDSVIYRSKPSDTAGTVLSDRFSFAASKAQGTAYSLTFRNTADKADTRAKMTVFTEIIYPNSSSIFIPFETRLR